MDAKSAGHDTAPPIRVACWPATVGIAYLESLYRALEPHGIRVSVDPLPSENSFLDRRRQEFDVVYLHWIEYLWNVGVSGRARRARDIFGVWRFVRRAKRLGIPVLWTVHNLQPHDGGDWIDRMGYQVMCRHSALLICHDEATRESLRRKFRLGSEPLVMGIGNNDLIWPPPDPHATVRADLGLAPDDRVLVCFGNLRPYKGFEVAVAAMHDLGEGYHLVIVGPPGDPRYTLELQRLAVGTRNITVMASRVDDLYLVDLLDAADCALFPYRRITGSGALFWAFTTGTGVVASDLRCFRETLSLAPEAGVLFRPGDAADLARAVREFFAVPLGTRSAAANVISAGMFFVESAAPAVGGGCPACGVVAGAPPQAATAIARTASPVETGACVLAIGPAQVVPAGGVRWNEWRGRQCRVTIERTVARGGFVRSTAEEPARRLVRLLCRGHQPAVGVRGRSCIVDPVIQN